MPYRRQTDGERQQPAPDKRAAPPPAHSVFLAEEQRHADDGGRQVGIFVDAILPTYYEGDVELWWQRSAEDPDAGRWEFGARVAQLPHLLQDPQIVKGDTFRVAVVTRTAWGHTIGPNGSPAATITLDGNGMIPDDVTGFTVAVDRGDIRFDWTAITDRRDVAGYEIRAGATGWLSATVVGRFGPWLRTWALVPRSKATGTSFYVKAFTRSETYSTNVATATLAAIDAQCADEDGPVAGQEVTILPGTRELTVTTRCPYAAAPLISFGSANPSTAPQLKRIVGYNSSDYAQNPDLTWSFTARASAVAPGAGGWFAHVYEKES